MPTTLIKNAAWVVAWDEAASRHAYRRGVDIAFADDRIVFVGKEFAGAADRVIDGGGRDGHAGPRSTSTRTRTTSRSIAASARSTASPACT